MTPVDPVWLEEETLWDLLWNLFCFQKCLISREIALFQPFFLRLVTWPWALYSEMHLCFEDLLRAVS